MKCPSTHRLSNDLGARLQKIESLLKELCKKHLKKQRTEYTCGTCDNTTVLDNQSLQDILLEKDFIQCEECGGEIINVLKHKTGYIFYDIKDKKALMSWQ